MANSVEIAKRCNLQITLGESVLPDFPIPQGMTEDEYFTRRSREGLEERLDELFDTGRADFAEIRKPYDERLKTELDVITQMKFPGYFLIVADFISGRRITVSRSDPDADPAQVHWLPMCWRLPISIRLNTTCCSSASSIPSGSPCRISTWIFAWTVATASSTTCRARYGEEKVSQIITYGTMAAKAVVRDVGRVMGHPYGFVDRIAKMVPFEIGMTLDKALKRVKTSPWPMARMRKSKSLIDMARSLEGLARDAGKHAGGVVIAPSGLTDFAPLYCEPDGSGLVTQFDKDDAEAVGLVKFDFLGLRTLTIIDKRCAYHQ